MPSQSISTIEINPKHKKPDASIVWLHGLGADGNDFASLVPMLNLSPELSIRFVFPNAPHRPVTLNGGYVMPAWYDIYGLKGDSEEDEAGILHTEKMIADLLEQEQQAGINSNRIILAGFSQGGAMALFTALRYPKPLAGIMGLSTYLPLANQLLTTFSTENARTPIFLGHGELDDLVPVSWGQFSYESLKKLGHQVEWHAYPTNHSVASQEIVDIAHWIEKVLAEK